jgi:catechol 2,3-dioxygenase-like lactoylglutathione lyase family enzyme
MGVLVRRLALLLALAGATAATAAPAPVTTRPWQEVVVSVTDLDRTARFFREIGGYEVKWRGSLDPAEVAAWSLPAGAGGEALLLGPSGQEAGLVRLVRFDDAGRREPMRPGARAWDTGCYFSIMIRMKDMQAIYDDAIALGWWTETPITDLSFGSSELKVVVYRGPDGVQVQGYERLSPPLPEAIPPFERMTGPFNMMQMVRDRDAAYAFYTDVLGFATFYKGKPYLADTPEYMPLGIPVNLTTEIPYRAGIVYPVPGEFGRMETIEIMGLDGRDYADRCTAPNLGILAVRFPVADAERAAQQVTARGWPLARPPARFPLAPYGPVEAFQVKTPDGAIIEFYASPGEAGTAAAGIPRAPGSPLASGFSNNPGRAP